MRKRLFGRLLLLSLICGLVTPAALSAPKSGPLNILWILAEDMGTDWGVYGEPESHTPNLNKLAKRGTRFTHVFTNTSICSTSRSSLYTGMYPTSIGAHHHRTMESVKKELPDGVELLPHILRKADYQTALLTDLGDDKIKGSKKRDWNFKYNEPVYDTNSIDDLSASKPFFAHVQFPESHRGFGHAKQYINVRADPNKVRIRPYYVDHPLVREDWADYLDNVSLFDQKVSFVIDQFKNRNLLKNTVIFIFSDHGRAQFRGKQWLYDSGVNIPFIVIWPKAHPLPKGYAVNSVSDQVISGIDITAQTLAIAGATLPPLMHGKPFLGNNRVIRKYAFSSRDRADETADYIRTVRDKRFRYIRNYRPELPYSQLNLYKETSYPALRLMRGMAQTGELNKAQAHFFQAKKPDHELYDLNADPFEVNNLAYDPQYQHELLRLQAVLDNWELETNDLGRLPEPKAAREFFARRIGKAMKNKIRKAKQDGSWTYRGKISDSYQ